ncbi:MAG: ATP-dependent Clp protease proteolytic subunit [Bacteroidota bacterium]
MSHSQEFKQYAKANYGLSEEFLNRYANSARNMTRSVIEERPQPFREIDVFSRLIMNRIVFLGSEINDQVSNVIVAQLLFLDSVDPKKEILLYINSPGGGIYAGLAIYDTMQYIQAPVGTICLGLAASMGAVLLAGGEKGKRASLPHSRMMIHQPLGGTQGQMEDMKITIKQIMGLGEDLYKILAHHTGQSLETIQQDANRDYWLRADESKKYGLIDHILTKSKE